MRVWKQLRFGIALAALALLVTGLTTGAKSPTDPDPGLVEPIAFVTITGTTQGVIEGSSAVEDVLGSIALVGFQYEFTSPQSASGVASGALQPQPMVLLKDPDNSTPLLWTAMLTNEILTHVLVRFYRTGGDGTPELDYSVQLFDARITGFSAVADVDTSGRLTETITFDYAAITWATEGGGIATWQGPRFAGFR